MIRIDERTARCFSHLRAAEFEPLVSYLRALRADSLERLAEVTDQQQIHRLQGAVGTLKDILQNIDQSEQLVKKLNR